MAPTPPAVGTQPDPPRPSPEQAAAEAPPRDQTSPSLSGGSEAVTSPTARIRILARQNPWLTRFWAELTPPQQQRVERAFRRTARLPTTAPLTPAAPCDALGLADRVELVFGRSGGDAGGNGGSSDDDG